MYIAHCQLHSIIRHLAQLRLDVGDPCLQDAIHGKDLTGSSGLLCFRDVVHGSRKAWCGLA
jgi:hypothetical protein